MQWKRKKTRVVVLKTDKINFKTKATVKDKEGQNIMIEGANQHKVITLLNNPTLT